MINVQKWIEEPVIAHEMISFCLHLVLLCGKRQTFEAFPEAEAVVRIPEKAHCFQLMAFAEGGKHPTGAGTEDLGQ